MHDEKVPLVVLAGAEYGTGSSRDWAAKGTLLLGVRAVIAVSFERIHRSNLVGMGILPLEMPKGETWESLGLTGEETIDIPGLGRSTCSRGDSQGRGPPRRWLGQGIRLPESDRYTGRAGVLPQRRDFADRAAEVAGELTRPLTCRLSAVA